MQQTNSLKHAINRAQQLTSDLQKEGVDENLLLFSILAFPSLSFEKILERVGFPIQEVQKSLMETLNGAKKSKSNSDHLTPKTRQLIEAAEILSKETFDLDYVSHELVFMCYLTEEFLPKSFKSVFGSETVDGVLSHPVISNVLPEIVYLLKDMDEVEEEEEDMMEVHSGFGNESENLCEMFENNPILSQFAENLNLKAAHGDFESIVDFDNKIDELASILCRKKKPNAILIGPSGSGKSSIVELLAQNIVKGDAPELLANKVIYSLDLSSMVAGTMYRGQFEERLRKFVDEIKKYNNIILFIDEIHTLIGAGGASGTLEASNALKPELARGTISCIGATTIQEYNHSIKLDAALDRRFERVMIKEPSKFAMQQILPEIIGTYEDFHGVKYTKEFTDNILNFCERYLPNRFYPDKAVTVIDHCGAQAKVKFWETDPSVKESQKNLYMGIDEEGNINQELFDEFNKKFTEWKARIDAEEPEVRLSHLSEFFDKLKNPLSSPQKALEAKSFLKKEYVGQKSVIDDFFSTVNCVSIGLGKKRGSHTPDSYVFYGQNGSGKSLLVQKLSEGLQKIGAEVFYYSGVQLSDSYSQYKIASDTNTGVSLCEKVLMSPNSVIIIDDFDMVDQTCHPLFKQILKEGKITLARGDVADFSNCKIIFTSKSKNAQSSLGFQNVSTETTSSMDAELNGLVEQSWELKPLSNRELERIVFRKLKQIRRNMQFENFDFTFSRKFIRDFVKENASVGAGEICKKLEEKIVPEVLSRIKDGLVSFSL